MENPQIIELPKFLDDRGNLSFLENENQVPFEIKRVHWIYDVPEGESRGGHAHKELYQLIVAASGAYTVELDDGKEKKTFHLDRSWKGLLVPSGLWRNLENFSSGAVLPCLASEKYDASDYIRDYDEFLKYKKS